jgi:hypothetical protein
METLVKFTSTPYPGLRPFRYDESDVFFGREQQTDQLLDRLSRTRFLAVTGASGCGKSSLVKAGMIPALRAGFMADVGSRWRIVEMHPGGSPLSQLAHALCKPEIIGPVQDSDESLALVGATLRRGPLGLIEIARGNEALREKALLVLVDQFEELFRYRDQIAFDEATAFVALLVASAAQRDVEIYVVITMRSDYLGKCALFHGLAEAVSDGQYLTPRMTRDELDQAITRPARVFGGSVDPALANRLLNDFGTDPDQLPLLQHALMRMWARCSTGSTTPRLTIADYQAIGGLSDALSNHADEAFCELTPDQKRIAEILFRRLTGSETGPRDVRSPAKVSEVAAIAAVQGTEVISILEAFRGPDRCFLVVQSVPTDDLLVDISHESLIRQWRRLKGWVEEESEAAIVYRRIRDWALRWKQGKAGLWRGPDLATALASRDRWPPRPEAWAARYSQPGEYHIAMEFLDASLNAELAATEVERAARHRQLRRARQLAVVCASTVLLLVGGILGYWVGFRLEHSRYFKSFVKVYGVPKGIDQLTERQVRHRSDSLKITTRGLFGDRPVIRMESVDAEGHVTGTNDVATGFAIQTAPVTNEARWEYVYDEGERVAAEVAFDRHGKRLRSTIYSPYDPNDQDHRSAYLIGGEGSFAPQAHSCSTFIRFDYTKEGYQARIHYLDRAGNPTPGIDGVYIQEHEYDGAGHEINLISRSRDGGMMNDRVGNAVMRYRYDSSGNAERQEAFDALGEPININDKGAEWQTGTYSYDSAGNTVDEAYWSADGSPGKNEDGCARRHLTYDEHGRAVAVQCQFGNGNPAPTTWGFSAWSIAYDEMGRPTEYSYLDSEGKHGKGPKGAFREVDRYDQEGHDVELALYSDDGSPVTGTEGYHRSVSTFEGGREVKTEFLDSADHPVAVADQHYSTITRQFDALGNETVETYLGPDGRPVNLGTRGYSSLHKTFDTCGRETEYRYFNVGGKPTRSDEGYAVLRREFDEANDVAAVSYFDESERPLRAKFGFARMTREFNRNGRLIEESYFDERGASVSKKAGYAILRRRYDDHNFELEESVFDAGGKPVLGEGGWARITNVRDDRGHNIETSYFGIDDKPLRLKQGYAKLTRRYDDNGVLIEESYFGPNGEPALSAEGWARISYGYDQDRRTTERAHFGVRGEPVLGTTDRYHRATRVFDKHGKVTEVAYFGTDGKPIDVWDQSRSRSCARITGPIEDPDTGQLSCFDAAGKLVQ